MPNKDNRGTTGDPKWIVDDHTGGNHSGTSRLRPGQANQAQGPDRTAELLKGVTTRDLLNQTDPSMRPPDKGVGSRG